MKKHWLRGVLLGLSLVLLLAAGCVDKDCIACYDETDVAPEGFMVPGEYVVNFSARGIEDGEYCAGLYQNGKLVRGGEDCGEPGVQEANGNFFVTCDPATWFLSSDIPEAESSSGRVADYRGVWSLRVTKVGNSSDDFIEWLIEWLVADDCPEEFVPEPGTMVLMGSGVVGLAGYATLRWRRRK